MCRRFLSLVLVCILVSSTVHSGGCVFYGGGSGAEGFQLMGESGLIASISYEDSMEDLTVMVRSDLEGDRAVWIFPVPAKPEETSIDIVGEFPEYRGHEVVSKAGYTIDEASPYMVFSQVWLLIPAGLWYLGAFSGMDDGRSRNLVYGVDNRVEVHGFLERGGLATEVVSMDEPGAFQAYLESKGIVIPEESLSMLRSYAGSGYSFVVSYLSDVEEYRETVGSGALAVRVRFPSDKIYYPLKLTSLYGEELIPVDIYVDGYIMPDLYESIYDNTRIGYYATESGEAYTRVSIRSPARKLTSDLWIGEEAPPEANLGYVISSNPTYSMLFLFLCYSCLSSLIAGLFIYRWRASIPKLLILGLSNVLTLIGFALASLSVLKGESVNSGKLQDFEVLDEDAARKFGVLLLFAALFIGALFVLDALKISPFPSMQSMIFYLFYMLFAMGLPIMIFVGIPLLVFVSLFHPRGRAGNYIIAFSIIFLVVTILSNWILVDLFPREVMLESGSGGWGGLQPAGVSYSQEGFLQVRLRNDLGVPVSMGDVSVTENISGSRCQIYPARGLRLEPGKELTIEGDCAPKSNEDIELIFDVGYQTISGDATLEERIENAYVTGFVEVST